jgi:hypothetical protein
MNATDLCMKLVLEKDCRGLLSLVHACELDEYKDLEFLYIIIEENLDSLLNCDVSGLSSLATLFSGTSHMSAYNRVSAKINDKISFRASLSSLPLVDLS